MERKGKGMEGNAKKKLQEAKGMDTLEIVSFLVFELFNVTAFCFQVRIFKFASFPYLFPVTLLHIISFAIFNYHYGAHLHLRFHLSCHYSFKSLSYTSPLLNDCRVLACSKSSSSLLNFPFQFPISFSIFMPFQNFSFPIPFEFSF